MCADTRCRSGIAGSIPRYGHDHCLPEFRHARCGASTRTTAPRRPMSVRSNGRPHPCRQKTESTLRSPVVIVRGCRNTDTRWPPGVPRARARRRHLGWRRSWLPPSSCSWPARSRGLSAAPTPRWSPSVSAGPVARSRRADLASWSCGPGLTDTMSAWWWRRHAATRSPCCRPAEMGRGLPGRADSRAHPYQDIEVATLSILRRLWPAGRRLGTVWWRRARESEAA
jgi:hypothetical protein